MDKALLQLLILLKLKKEEIEYDWLGFKVTKDNYITGHHIVSKCEGGEDSIDNMALLSLLSHRYLHEVIEQYDIDTFNKINEILKQACISRREPNEKEYQEILYLIYNFEKNNKKVLKNRIGNLHINPKVIKMFEGIVDINTPHGYRIVLQNGVDPIKRHEVKTKKKKKRSDSY